MTGARRTGSTSESECDLKGGRVKALPQTRLRPISSASRAPSSGRDSGQPVPAFAVGLEREEALVEHARGSSGGRSRRWPHQAGARAAGDRACASAGSSSAAVASSRNSQSGFCSSARAIDSLCCSPHGEPVGPIGGLVERLAQMRKPGRVQHLVDLVRREGVVRPGIGKRAAQRAERQIRPLRQHQQLRALAGCGWCRRRTATRRRARGTGSSCPSPTAR